MDKTIVNVKCSVCSKIFRNISDSNFICTCGSRRFVDLDAESLKAKLLPSLEVIYDVLTKAGERPEDTRIRTADYEIQYYSSGECFVRRRF